MKKDLPLPLAVISLGIGWLLNALGVHPEVDWLWTIGLAATGFLVLFSADWNRTTFTSGSFLIAASAGSLLRQTGRLSIDIEVPLLVIVLGLLLLVSRCTSIPSGPEWLAPRDTTDR